MVAMAAPPAPPAHCGDEDGIEDDVDDRAADAADHGLGGHALAADEVGMDKVQHRGRGTNGQHGVIGLCVRHRLSSRTQNAQQRDADSIIRAANTTPVVKAT